MKWFLLLVLSAVLIPTSALAHPVDAALGLNFLSGFLHPFSGLDHMLAMLAIGVWAGLQPHKPWPVPLAFSTSALLGLLGAAGAVSVHAPAIETGIATSLIGIGSMLLFSVRVGIWAIPVVAMFGIFHGMAHGLNLQSDPLPMAFAAGFFCATLLLHLAGIAIGRSLGISVWIRSGGAGVVATGLVFMMIG